MPPDNGAFMVAAYVVVVVVLLAYTASLLIRIREQRKR